MPITPADYARPLTAAGDYSFPATIPAGNFCDFVLTGNFSGAAVTPGYISAAGAFVALGAAITAAATPGPYSLPPGPTPGDLTPGQATPALSISGGVSPSITLLVTQRQSGVLPINADSIADALGYIPAAKDGSNITDPDDFAQNIGMPAANVMSFGAVGDGVADDTLAIQAAMDSGRSVFFPIPPAYYKITSELLIKRSHVTLLGVGFGGSAIRQTVASKGVIKQLGQNDYFYMEGITAQGTGIDTSTATVVDLSSSIGGYTFRHAIHRCIIMNGQTGLKTGSTTMFVASHLQAGSSQLDIDITGADIATFTSVGTGRSFGNGLSFPGIRSQGWKCHGNFSVTINNMDAGNCNQLMSLDRSNVTITNANWENLGDDRTIQVGEMAVLTLNGGIKVLGGASGANLTMIAVLGDASFIGTANINSHITSAGGTPWRILGAYGAFPYNAQINYRGPVSSAPPVYMGLHTVPAKVTPLVPFNIYIGGTVKSAPGSNRDKWGHWPGREDGGPSFASFMDDHFMFPVIDRFGHRWSDFVTENHFKVIGFAGQSANTSSTKTSLSSYTLRAYELLRAGETLSLSASGVTADNANLKKWTLDLAGVTQFDSGTMTAQNVSWSFDAQIRLISQWSSSWDVTLIVGGVVTKKVILSAFNFAAASPAGVNGLNLTATGVATNDVLQYSSKLKWERGLLTMTP